jgi:hypothetical protein
MRHLAYSFVVQLTRVRLGPALAALNLALQVLYWRARRSSEWHHSAHGNSRKESSRTRLSLASGQFLHGDRRVSRRRGRSIGSGDTGALAGGVRQAFAQSTPVRFAVMRSMLYCRVPSRA